MRAHQASSDLHVESPQDDGTSGCHDAGSLMYLLSVEILTLQVCLLHELYPPPQGLVSCCCASVQNADSVAEA